MLYMLDQQVLQQGQSRRWSAQQAQFVVRWVKYHGSHLQARRFQVKIKSICFLELNIICVF